jgi:N-acetylglucosamine transport system permease protein
MATTDTTKAVIAAPQTTARASKSTRGGSISGGFSQLILIVWALMVILPFLWMVMSSFKTDNEIILSPWNFPNSLQWDNFTRAWSQARIGAYVQNSLIVVTGSVFLTLFCSSMTAYVLARYEFPLNRPIFYLFMVGLLFPVFLALVPLFFVVQDLHLLGTYQGLILVYTAYSLPFSIFFLTSFFRTLPSELAEAAIIDGASHYRVFFNIMLPLAKPGLVAIGIFNVLGQWNQFILPLVLNPNPDKYLLSQGLAFLAIQQGYDNDYSALFAALTITMVPTLVVYIIFQRRLEGGLTAGALKA